ncbi:pilus assembly protein TadE [Micromonospora arborensis]|uniref:Pilus assembly protein TadE n=1 Tax=Micromonospora arborensis TaxID=2116518 RepID=A0A318NRW0_9ACTN|nr:TadE family protein [Micromonospora arborensis]PYC73355.1 pilus assembly protein TadE [Micromonospora arborensis]
MSRATYPGWHRAVTAARGRFAGSDRERGANPVELAVLMPLILVLLFASVQIAAVFLARSTALNAAQSGVNAQRPYQAPNGAGVDSATRFLNAAGGWLVGWQTTLPSCVTDDTDVTCTVRGRSLSVIPGVDFAVQQTAHGTVERVTQP